MSVSTPSELEHSIRLRREQCSKTASPLSVLIIRATNHLVFHISNPLKTVNCILREAFRVQEAKKAKPNNRHEGNSGDDITISLHIRRGDVASEHFKESNRWINNAAYIDIANSLYQILQKICGGRKKKFIFQLFVEGSTSINSVQDVAENGFPRTDMEKEIRGVLGEGVTVILGPTDLLESFSSMCQSDVFVSSNSGFSSLIAKLCDHPITLYTAWADFGGETPTNCIGVSVKKINGSSIQNSFDFNTTEFYESAQRKICT